jgi:hypothetical protein
MKRQIAKGLAMLMLTLALAAASAAVANGQAKARLVADVPFEFMVADKTLSAGKYRVTSVDQSGETIAITNAHGDNAIRLSMPRERKDREKAAKLVFHRYGSTYFLSQVWRAGEATGRELPKSKQERAIERELKVASNGRTFETVEVVAIMAR